MSEHDGKWIVTETTAGIAMSHEYANGMADNIPTLIRKSDVPGIMDQFAKIMGSVPQYPDISRARLWIQPFRSRREGEDERIRYRLVTSTGEVLPDIYNWGDIDVHLRKILTIVEAFDVRKRLQVEEKKTDDKNK